jgi:hypothetical protein
MVIKTKKKQFFLALIMILASIGWSFDVFAQDYPINNLVWMSETEEVYFENFASTVVSLKIQLKNNDIKPLNNFMILVAGTDPAMNFAVQEIRSKGGTTCTKWEDVCSKTDARSGNCLSSSRECSQYGPSQYDKPIFYNIPLQKSEQQAEEGFTLYESELPYIMNSGDSSSVLIQYRAGLAKKETLVYSYEFQTPVLPFPAQNIKTAFNGADEVAFASKPAEKSQVPHFPSRLLVSLYGAENQVMEKFSQEMDTLTGKMEEQGSVAALTSVSYTGSYSKNLSLVYSSKIFALFYALLPLILAFLLWKYVLRAGPVKDKLTARWGAFKVFLKKRPNLETALVSLTLAFATVVFLLSSYFTANHALEDYKMEDISDKVSNVKWLNIFGGIEVIIIVAWFVAIIAGPIYYYKKQGNKKTGYIISFLTLLMSFLILSIIFSV